ncbi:MAG: metalloregulator ArsR/SmtB family transcription factor [Bacteroidota bacterium]|nr:metalloregulator ArsR/SmtB family transcription factor [Bacteroidota bacterium]
MGLTKTEIFSHHQNKLATFFRVLAHPARISILQHLILVKECICGDLVKEIGLSQPTISQHLKELKNLDLIKGNIEGTSICYCINEEKWQEIKLIFKEFFDQDISIKKECC